MISLTAIADLMFDRFEIGKTLVIAPLRVARTVWPEEWKKWDGLDFLRMSVMVGDAKQRAAALRKEADVYVINRDNLKWLTDYLEKHQMIWPFDMVVIDELSSFKNHESQRWRALRKVRPFIRRIVGLTGTPASNGLMDLWAEVYLIDKGERLGPFIRRYREAYFKPVGQNPYTGVVYNYIPRPGAEEQIYRKISDISVSMRGKDYLEMPERIENRVEVQMDDRERGIYDRMKRELIVQVEGREIDAVNAGALVGKLCQMANGAVYTGDLGRDSGVERRTGRWGQGNPAHPVGGPGSPVPAGPSVKIHDRKLDALEDLIEGANGKPLLVAYWFRHDLERMKERFPEMRELRTSEDIRDWNAERIPVAAIHPASAGHGLNLQEGGNQLVWFGLTWSLELYQQTNARLWRQGQKDGTVIIHHIITQGTIDEQIMAALERKDQTQRALIEAVKAELSAG